MQLRHARACAPGPLSQYAVTAAGLNVYDVTIGGQVVSSYNDAFLLAGSHQYAGYTLNYPATVSNGQLQVGIITREISTYGAGIGSLMIAPTGGCTLVVNTTVLPNGVQNQAYIAALSASCGTPPYSWSIISGTLCTGLTLSSSGTITGVPTVLGSCPFKV